jgi:TRAP-type transport system periplasmic protein
MESKLAVRVSLVLFIFAVCLALPPVVSSAEKVIGLNYSNFFPAPHKNSILADQWCKEVEKRTNGKVKIAYFPGGTLTPAAQTYDSVTKGIADIGYSVFAYTRGKFPLTEVIDLPIGVESGGVATAMINEYYARFKPKELDEVKILYLHAHGPGIIHTKRPVNKLEDLKGMKIRATGLAAKIVSALGAAPVGTTMPETYDSLRTGIVEGAMAPFEALQGFKWGEVISSSTVDYGAAYSSAFFVVMNKAKWNSLPEDVKKVIDQVSREWIPKQGQLWDEIDKEGLEFTKKRGNKVIYLSKGEDARWTAAVKPLLEDYVKSMKAKNLPGEEALKFCLDYLKANHK